MCKEEFCILLLYSLSIAEHISKGVKEESCATEEEDVFNIPGRERESYDSLDTCDS